MGGGGSLPGIGLNTGGGGLSSADSASSSTGNISTGGISFGAKQSQAEGLAMWAALAIVGLVVAKKFL